MLCGAVAPGGGGEHAISVTAEVAVLRGRSQEEWRGEIIQLSWSPRAFLLKGFLSDAECEHLITKATPSMVKSSVVDNKTGKSVDSNIRTSTGTFFGKAADAVITTIEKRVAQVTMLPIDNQEGMQILHYHDGEKYEPHYDYFHDAYNARPANGGQRIMTMLMYLTTVEEGGETVFPNADRKVQGPEWSKCATDGLAVKPRRGDAVMFFSLHPDGKTDTSSLHGSCPTLRGDKWSATKWIHVGPFGVSASAQKAKWAGRDAASGPCADLEPECADWEESGECDKNPTYMSAHCAKSCHLCTDAPA